jgi:O-antigen ligase
VSAVGSAVPAAARRGDGGDEAGAPLPSIFLRAGIFLSFAGIVVLRPALPQNTAFVDPIIVAVSIYGLIQMSRRGSLATEAAWRAFPWLWMILFSSVLALGGVGLTFWAVTDLARSYFAFLSFFTFWHLIYTMKLERYAIRGSAVGLLITTVALFGGGAGLRQSAFFAQPNYPAHYVVLTASVLLYASRRWISRILLVGAIGVAVWQTGSFGSVAMIGVILGVLVWRSLIRHSALLAMGLIIVMVVGFLAISGTKLDLSGGWNFSQSLNSSRFDKSQGSRYQLWGQAITAWRQEPLGLGPNGVLNRNIGTVLGTSLEVHNDALSFLVERGPLGLLGFLGLWWTIWKFAPRRGFGRVLIIAVLLAGVFRETMHYRHVWLLLALCLALDQQRQDEREPAEDHRDAIEVDTVEPEAGVA